MERVINGRILCDTYDSIAEYAEISQRDRHPENTPIRPATLALVRDGWNVDIPEALNVASTAVEQAPRLMESANFAAHWDVTGCEVDVGAYLAGTPECMIDYPVQQTVSFGRVVTIVSSMDANAGLGNGGYQARGRAATALAMAVSRLGYSVELWADNFGGDLWLSRAEMPPEMYDRYCKRVTAEVYQRMLVKGPNDSLDPAHVMYAFGHRSMLNELAFGTFDGFPGVWGATHAYGNARGCAWDDRPEWVRGLYPEGAIFITGMAHSLDAEGMSAYVMGELRKLGLLAE